MVLNELREVKRRFRKWLGNSMSWVAPNKKVRIRDKHLAQEGIDTFSFESFYLTSHDLFKAYLAGYEAAKKEYL